MMKIGINNNNSNNIVNVMEKFAFEITNLLLLEPWRVRFDAVSLVSFGAVEL